MIVSAARASAILHDLLVATPDRRPFVVPANVCPIVAVTLLTAGRPFVLVDVDPETLELDTDRTLALLRTQPDGFGGVLFVRPYGAERDAAPFFAALREVQPDLLLVDDRCLCLPDPDGERLTCGADATLFSTGRAKALDLGGGGFAHLAGNIEYLATEGAYDPDALAEVERRYHEAVDDGSPFSGPVDGWLALRGAPWSWAEYRRRIHAALPETIVHRQRLTAIYAAAIPAAVQLPEAFHGWRFQIRVRQPERLVGAIFDAGLFASRHYPPLDAAFAGEPAPVATALHAGIVNLFNDRHYDATMAERTAEIVRSHVRATTGATE